MKTFDFTEELDGDLINSFKNELECMIENTTDHMYSSYLIKALNEILGKQIIYAISIEV